MKTQYLKASLLAVALLGTSTAFAAADGTPAAESAKITHQVAVAPQTQYFNVHPGDTLRFTLDGGKSFSWKFDGTSNYVNLSDIAPKGSVNQDIKVYVGSRSKRL